MVTIFCHLAGRQIRVWVSLAQALAAVSRSDEWTSHGLIYRAERPTLTQKVLPKGARPSREDLEATLSSKRDELKRLRGLFT